jgi:hypothetical protein
MRPVVPRRHQDEVGENTMQRRERRRLAREEQARTARRRAPIGLIIGGVALVAIVAGGFFVVQAAAQNRKPVAAVPTTPTAVVPTPTLVTALTPEPTAPTAAFTVIDRCVTTTLETNPGPVFSRGGGLELEMRVASLTMLSYVANMPGDVVCGSTPASPEAVDAMVKGIAEIPGIEVRGYTYNPGSGG